MQIFQSAKVAPIVSSKDQNSFYVNASDKFKFKNFRGQFSAMMTDSESSSEKKNEFGEACLMHNSVASLSRHPRTSSRLCAVDIDSSPTKTQGGGYERKEKTRNHATFAFCLISGALHFRAYRCRNEWISRSQFRLKFNYKVILVKPCYRHINSHELLAQIKNRVLLCSEGRHRSNGEREIKRILFDKCSASWNLFACENVNGPLQCELSFNVVYFW